jgi:hypothetical protein
MGKFAYRRYNNLIKTLARVMSGIQEARGVRQLRTT